MLDRKVGRPGALEDAGGHPAADLPELPLVRADSGHHARHRHQVLVADQDRKLLRDRGASDLVRRAPQQRFLQDEDRVRVGPAEPPERRDGGGLVADRSRDERHAGRGGDLLQIRHLDTVGREARIARSGCRSGWVARPPGRRTGALPTRRRGARRSRRSGRRPGRAAPAPLAIEGQARAAASPPASRPAPCTLSTRSTWETLLVPTEPRQEASVCQTPGVQAMMRPVRTAREGEPIQVTVYGAGAIGGYTGAALARAGHDVLLVDLAEAHVAEMKESGLTIETPEGRWTAPVRAVTPHDFGGQHDLVLLAVKSQHTGDALRTLVPHLAPRGILVSLQNGLNEELIAGHIGSWSQSRSSGSPTTSGATSGPSTSTAPSSSPPRSWTRTSTRWSSAPVPSSACSSRWSPRGWRSRRRRASGSRPSTSTIRGSTAPRSAATTWRSTRRWPPSPSTTAPARRPRPASGAISPSGSARRRWTASSAPHSRRPRSSACRCRSRAG